MYGPHDPRGSPGDDRTVSVFLLFTQWAHEAGISCSPSGNSGLILNLGADSLAYACDILGHQVIRHHVHQCTCGRSQGVEHDYSASQHLLCCTRPPISAVNSLQQVLTLPPHQALNMSKITKSSAMVHIPSAYIRASLDKIGLRSRDDRPPEHPHRILESCVTRLHHPCDGIEGVVHFVHAPIPQRHPMSGA